MGYAIAGAAVDAGARVTLVSGPVQLDTPDDVDRIDVESAQDMHDVVHKHIADTDIFISAAAVADFRPADARDKKIKKSGGTETLTLEPCPDILSSVGHLAEPPFTVGFAAETCDVKDNALKKLARKKLNMIAANRVGDVNTDGQSVGFETDDNELTVLWSGGEQQLARDAKTVLARQLIELVASRYKETTS
jgi:phosphopantothenoylcysteine decarboxylase/phosphopantothenate--cysteine ligase